MSDRVPSWVRLGIIVTMAVPQLLIGLWAVLAPHNWFDSFPGIEPHVVAAEPPYNRHLVSDVGAGFLATGLVLLVAALWAHRVAVLTALLAFAAFTVPHVLYHATHWPDALSSAENVMNVLSLASGLVLGGVYARGSRSATAAPSESVTARTRGLRPSTTG